MSAVHGTACMGKLPSHGDFVRHGADAPWQQRLFDWLVEGWSRALSTGRLRDLDRRLFALCATDRADRAAALCVQPSRDQVGRRFPFVALAELDGDLSRPGALLPGAFAWLEAAVPVCELASRGAPVAEVRAHVDALKARAAAAPDVDFAAWCGETALATVLRRGAAASSADWLRSAEYSVSAPGVPEYVVRGAGASGALELGFAADLFAVLGAAPLRMIVCDETPDRGWRFRLLWDELRPRYLAPLFWPDAPSDLAWDVAPGRDQVPASFAGRAAARVDLGIVSVQQVLEVERDGPR